MSPLIFLAIAAVVPLIGMIVLGAAARIKRARISDDDSEPFRRRLANLAPQPVCRAPAQGVPRPPVPLNGPATSSIRLIERGVAHHED